MRSRIRGRQCPRTKRVLGWSGFRFGAIDMTNINKRERGKKKTIRKAPNTFQIASILKIEYVCMGMHGHVTCKGNCIMGSGQSNLISTQPV